MKTFILALALLSAAAAPNAQAQTIGGLPALPADTPVRGATGPPGSSDVFAVVTVPGERHTFTLRSVSTKPVELLFLDPAGHVVLSQSGTREVKLEAVASFAGAYGVAVIRSDTNVPYVLQRTTEPTTIERIIVAMVVGYEFKTDKGIVVSHCWLKPGVKARRTYPDAVDEVEVLPGAFFGRRVSGSRAGTSVTTTYAINGNQVTELERGPDGEKTFTYDLLPEYMEQSAGIKFLGYMC